MKSITIGIFGIFCFLLGAPLFAQEENPKTSARGYLRADRRDLSVREQNRLEEIARKRGNASYEKGNFIDDMDGSKKPLAETLFWWIFVGSIFAVAFVMAYNYMLGLTADKGEVIQEREKALEAKERAAREKFLAD